MQGSFNKFRITGGGGTYSAGSQQVVSYDYPPGSPVKSINIIKIVSGSNFFNPTVLSGIPVAFPVNSPDLACSINLVIPNNITSGQYVFRLFLSTSSVFTAVASQQNQCQIGTSQCNGVNTFQNCVSTNNENTYGQTNTCSAGQSCTQSGKTAVCSFSQGSCQLGSFRCFGTGYQQCVQTNSGNKYTSVQQCAAGTQCQQSGNSIACVAAVCSVHANNHKVETTFQDLNCPVGTVCTGNGQCTFQSQNSCNLGYMKCASSTTWQQCQQTSSSSAFGPAQQCSPGTTCQSYQNNYIICS